MTLLNKSLEEVPHLVAFIFLAAASKIPIGHALYEQALKDHPEYFEEELEYRRKWEAIPESVHEQYQKAIDALPKEEMPESKGMVYWSRNPQEYQEWVKVTAPIFKRQERRERNLFNFFYGPYGITKP